MAQCPECEGTYDGYGLCESCRAERFRREIGLAQAFPKIVCLCGSTRFMDAFHETGWQLTLAGYIVLSVGVCKHAEHHGGEALGQDVADKLDELHKRKIDLADWVLVLNVDGYVGDSTQAEIEYAAVKGKQISYLAEEDIADSDPIL